MAAVGTSIVAFGSASVALQSAVSEKSVARFNGLRACPVLRYRANVNCRSVTQRIVVTAGAEESTLTTVRSIIAKQLDVNPSTVLPESKFSDLGADSLDTVEIVMAMEEEFKVSLEEDRAEKIATVQEAADLIQTVIKPLA